METFNAKCTNCGEEIAVNIREDANICPKCNKAFVTEKAVALYNKERISETEQKEERKRKAVKIFRSLGSAILMILECIGYLFYVIFFLWLFIDITDFHKKK